MPSIVVGKLTSIAFRFLFAASWLSLSAMNLALCDLERSEIRSCDSRDELRREAPMMSDDELAIL